MRELARRDWHQIDADWDLKLLLPTMSESPKYIWSIGIYVGDSPFHLAEPADTKCPVLTRESVSDVSAEFVADPFMVNRAGVWNMFFEVMNQATHKGEIGLATSDNGLDWTYQQIVIKEPFHLSYPYVFEWQDDYYMVPETLDAGGVYLYKADNFPSRWSRVEQLIAGRLADPSIFHFDNRWWMFACSTPYQHDTLRLYFAEQLGGPWQEHPASPIIKDNKSHARPAGRMLAWDDKLVRFAQDCVPRYGSLVRAFEISSLTSDRYAESESHHSPVLTASGSGWNALGMHHLDAQLTAKGQWIACVDGFSNAGILAWQS